MNSLILKVVTRFLVWLMIVFSLFVLWRGHNQPGGGFIGGIIAASAISLYAMTYGVRKAQRFIRLPVSSLLALGILLTTTSSLLPFLLGKMFFTGVWWHNEILTVGTPMLFDVGVYITVIAAVLFMVFTLEDKPKEE